MEYELKDPDTDLTELLAREFNVNFIRARNVAREISCGAFLENYEVLESLVGEGFAKEVVKNGDFLSYRNGSLDEYFRLVRIYASQREGVEVSFFYSIESLNSKNRKESDSFNIGKLDVSRNKLFNLDNDQTNKYLNSLIENGYLTVSTHEHWCKSKDGENGPRSNHILQRIAYLLKTGFAELGLERPEVNINNGTITLEIGERTRKNLKKIVDELMEKSLVKVS